MKTRKGREGAALRELCAALEAAAVAGGETIGVSNGMIPLACGVTLAARIDNDLAWSVRWVPCEASNPSTVDEYGRTVGAVELLINGGLSSSHPVRRQPVR